MGVIIQAPCGALMKKIITTMLLVCGFSSAANAQDLVYQPVNPSFGGNPFNSAHLLAIANAQNDFERPVEEATSQDELDRFVRSLQSRLLSSLSTQVANAIFGEDAQDEGRIVFGDQTIEFVRTLDGIQLTITEADGSTTVITIPVFTTDFPEDDADADAEGSSGKTQTSQSELLVIGNSDSLLAGSILGQESLLSTTAEQPIR